MDAMGVPYNARAYIGVSLVDILVGAGLPAPKARHIVSTLMIESVAALEEAAENGTLKALLGGRTNMDDHVLRFIRLGKRIAPSTRIADQAGAGVPLAHAAWVGRMVLSALRAVPGVLSAAMAGQVRRQCEIVDSLDLVVSTENPVGLARAPVGLPVALSAATAPDILCANALSMDIRIHVTTPRGFAGCLLDATGSACHGHRLAKLAAERGLLLDRGALVHAITGRQILLGDEAEIYAQLGLPFIPPEYRVGGDEVEEALAGTLLRPVAHEDMQGDLHLHTDWSDGLDTVEDIVAEAARRGYSYVAVSDHTAYHVAAHGLSAERLPAQWEAIDRLQRRYPSIAILEGAEVDILPDGTLDIADDVLRKADIVLASVHRHADMEPRMLTRRLIRAMENPHVDVLAHPTGRSVGKSDYRVDVEELLCAAARLGVALEINCAPNRLDLDEESVRRCVDLGIALAIGSDAHSVGEMDQFSLGVGVAQRARCTSHNILNARSPRELRAWLDWHRNH